MSKVTFDGDNSLMLVSMGVTQLDTKLDIYNSWKEWAVQGNNAKYSQAISVIGGDPIGSGTYLGTTYFLENGWKVRPHEASHTLTIAGNLYCRDGTSPIVHTLGNYNVLVSMARSNLVDAIATSGGSGSVDLTPVLNKLDSLSISVDLSGVMDKLNSIESLIASLPENSPIDLSVIMRKLNDIEALAAAGIQ